MRTSATGADAIFGATAWCDENYPRRDSNGRVHHTDLCMGANACEKTRNRRTTGCGVFFDRRSIFEHWRQGSTTPPPAAVWTSASSAPPAAPPAPSVGPTREPVPGRPAGARAAAFHAGIVATNVVTRRRAVPRAAPPRTAQRRPSYCSRETRRATARRDS